MDCCLPSESAHSGSYSSLLTFMQTEEDNELPSPPEKKTEDTKQRQRILSDLMTGMPMVPPVKRKIRCSCGELLEPD